MNRNEIHDILGKRVLLLDGATGSEFLKRSPEVKTPELLNLEDPELVKEIHQGYIRAGSQIIITNTFGANPHKMAHYGIKDHQEIIRAGVRLAREAAGDGVLVFGDIGPSGELPFPLGDQDFKFFYSIYREMAEILVEEGVDGIILETFTDIFELKVAILAVRDVSKDVFLAAQLSFEENGRTLTGTTPANFALIAGDLDVDCLGMNCSLGPARMLPLFRELASNTDKFLSVEPNAGLPRLEKGQTHYHMGPEEFAELTRQFREAGANIVGGCCGTTPEHISTLKESLKSVKPVPRKLKNPKQNQIPVISSPFRTVSFEDFVVIGERINPAGWERMKKAIETRDLDYIVEEGRRQAEGGAQVLDVNFGIEATVPLEFMEQVIMALAFNVGLPLSLDIQTPELLEHLMKVYPGRPLVNSSRALEGELHQRLGFISSYGGVLIVLSMEREVPADVEDRKKAINWARGELDKLGLTPDRVVFDPIVLAMGAGGKPKDTLAAIAYISKLGFSTTFGLSNLSFGIPDKEFYNASFLALALEKGLTSAIMNPLNELQMTVLKTTLTLLGRRELPGAETAGEGEMVALMIKGHHEELKTKVKDFLKELGPLEVVEQHLRPAMERVGELYAAGDLFLPQLILAAQTVKPGFALVEELLPGGGRDRFVIATVEGDVHDIGKNIVAAVIRSSGFDVIDLGKDVTTAEIISTVKDKQPLALGLSAMMTTTIPRIKEVVAALREESIDVVVIAGGASLTEELAKDFGVDHYAKSAIDGLRVLEKLRHEE